MQLIPTIYLPGRCADAMSFYRDALGAEPVFEVPIGAMFPSGVATPGTEHKMLRAALRFGDNLIYLSDGHRPGPPSFDGFALTIHLADQDEAARALQALAREGQVRIALRATAWAHAHGTVIDKFGVHWTIESGSRLA